MRETFFGVLQEVAKEVDGKIVEVGLIDYIKELGFIPKNDLKPLEIAVVWDYDGEDNVVDHIYETRNGMVIVDFEGAKEWTDEHEELMNAILMYAELEPKSDYGWI